MHTTQIIAYHKLQVRAKGLQPLQGSCFNAGVPNLFDSCTPKKFCSDLEPPIIYIQELYFKPSERNLNFLVCEENLQP